MDSQFCTLDCMMASLVYCMMTSDRWTVPLVNITTRKKTGKFKLGQTVAGIYCAYRISILLNFVLISASNFPLNMTAVRSS